MQKLISTVNTMFAHLQLVENRGLASIVQAHDNNLVL